MLYAVRCKWLTPGTEQEVPLADCRACASTGANPCGYPLPLIQVMTKDRDPKVVRCSATMFGGCAREHGIKKHHPYSIDPDETYTRAFGTLVHRGAEETSREYHAGPELERRLQRSILLDDGREMMVTAALDVLHQNTDGTVSIRDYKAVDSVSDSSIARRLEHHVPQFSIQKWILEGNALVVRDIELYFLCHRGRRNVVLYPEGSPEFSGAYVMSAGATEAYLRERGPALLSSLEGELAAPITEKQDLWRCRRCDVRELCERLYGRPLPVNEG